MIVSSSQHAWDEPIGQFCYSLERSGEEGPFWICAFAIYQNHGDDDKPTIFEQLGPDPEYGPFATVLKGADSMVAVVTETCDIYSRLWYVLNETNVICVVAYYNTVNYISNIFLMSFLLLLVQYQHSQVCV